jgi:hypothetical protein
MAGAYQSGAPLVSLPNPLVSDSANKFSRKNGENALAYDSSSRMAGAYPSGVLLISLPYPLMLDSAKKFCQGKHSSLLLFFDNGRSLPEWSSTYLLALPSDIRLG